MTYREPARTTARRIPWPLVAGLLVAMAASAAALGYPLLTSPPSTAAPPIAAPRSEQSPPGPPSPQPTEEAAPPSSASHSEQPPQHLPPRQATGEAAAPIDTPPQKPPGGAPGEADGVVPDGTSVFDAALPGVANLDPALLAALRRAAADAAGDGVAFSVTSGWRSPAYQEQLFQEAVVTYGSEAEAARWVATADTSPHVSGEAIDIGPAAATAWLSEHGAAYGLCQIYRNEPWHYELRPAAFDHGCPPTYADPTRDPRMQR